MFTRFLTYLPCVLVGVLAVTTVAHVVYAQEATSSTFLMRNSTTNSFGGEGSSSSFSAIQSGDQVGGGESTSTSFLVDAGFLYYDSFTPKQNTWRWYDDENNETPTSPLASENVAPSNISNANSIKLRVALSEIGGFSGTNLKYRVQFSTVSDFSSNSFFVEETSLCTSTSTWCYANGGGADNALISTAVLSSTDSCVSGVGNGCGTHNESATSSSSYTHAANATAEYEFTLQESGSAGNTVYFFRLVNTSDNTPVTLIASSTYPSLSTTQGTLTFTIGGIASSTLTSGTTTTIDTTSTAVPFGALMSGSSAIGAQRLTVTTNASQGYEIFSFATQGFVGSGSEIPPVDGTNSTPLGWSSGCIYNASGCYGYHTNESVLQGGSTRFAADDSFARFSTTTPDEVAYSAGPSIARSTDMVYKTEIHDLQDADSYSTNVVYVVVPTF